MSYGKVINILQVDLSLTQTEVQCLLREYAIRVLNPNESLFLCHGH